MSFDDLRIPAHVTVAIVGAGPAGLGVARVLRDLTIPDVWVLERGRIGQSVLRGPSGTRLLPQCFPGNVFGMTDLDAISYDSSPGWSLKREHPDGGAYARYLEQASLAFGLNVACGIGVQGLEPDGDGFALRTDRGAIGADFVIWSCGQFGPPSDGGLIGADHAGHYAAVTRWQDVPGDEVFVTGGYESGIDAALGLARAGQRVTVLERGAAPWLGGDKDPSRTLSPFTRQRLDVAMKGGAITLIDGVEAIALEPAPGGIRILAGDGRSWLSPHPPILATGFFSGTVPVSDWCDYNKSGLPLLTPQDESTELPGLFLVGSEVSHNGYLFRFIYKFRQRFAVVARAIAGRLGADTGAIKACRANTKYLHDPACRDTDRCLC